MSKRKSRSCWGGGTNGRGRITGKGCRRGIWWKYSVLMYENGKMRPVAAIPGMGVGEIKENDGGGEFN
jgi:hypothetical protein